MAKGEDIWGKDIDVYIYTSQKLTWHLKMVVSNRNLLFQRSIFRSYVSFRECIFFLNPGNEPKNSEKSH